MYVGKQTFHISRDRITQKMNAVIKLNFRHIIFILRQRYL